MVGAPLTAGDHRATVMREGRMWRGAMIKDDPPATESQISSGFATVVYP
jgi:hypothetical protein